jgi:hypothetical protein
MEWSPPHMLRKTKGAIVLDLNKLGVFKLIPLSKERIETLKQCKQLIPAKQKLDFEDDWDAWEVGQKKYVVKEIIGCRKRGNLVEYKVKFKDDKFTKYSQDKFDEWIAESELEDASTLVKAFKGEMKICKYIIAIHNSDKEKKIMLVQWRGFPNKSDWTWEEKAKVQQICPEKYQEFKVLNLK